MTMLGTGHAMVKECYNTCYVLHGDTQGGPLMVDGGGGNGVLRQLDRAGFDPKRLPDIFVTHKHVDHILGIVWMMRVIASAMNSGRYEGEARIYSHDQAIGMLDRMAEGLLQPNEYAQVGKRLHLVEVRDGEELEIAGRKMEFFDIQSTKAKQFGFRMTLASGTQVVCCGDEPCSAAGERYAKGADWLFHEAFCLKSQADAYKPYEKHHSTVADACELAERLGVGNLVLYHTEEQNLADRKRLYRAEGEPLFSGNLHIPDDLETLEID
ncbi:MBL fold metallo-hydrolase [Curtanaerobium respiraculi]|uniref:MBL fold metallo-hydrolase n=1 Tax=Curtanaerobium respiraculi TaxID=2949669 RepID=UPI0024B3B15C|nr:MBL fold metallo-hydrolase [Curtanaerobium respiraculi]